MLEEEKNDKVAEVTNRYRFVPKKKLGDSGTFTSISTISATFMTQRHSRLSHLK